VSGRNLELDCYCPELNLALEYQGEQHYRYKPWFHRNESEFQAQVYRDNMKRRILMEKGINLIEVPYTVKPQNFENFIIKEANKLGYNVRPS